MKNPSIFISAAATVVMCVISAAFFSHFPSAEALILGFMASYVAIETLDMVTATKHIVEDFETLGVRVLVMPVADHDRIVAEPRAEVERVTSQYQASSIEWGQTIARQARVIEKLYEQRGMVISFCRSGEYVTDGEIKEMNLELAAIERAEGEKEHE